MHMERSGKIFLSVISLSVATVILVTGYTFLIQKDYNFIVEAACEPSSEICFHRDCSSGECPPNELAYYKTFLISAGDFRKCSDNSCAQECASTAIRCEEIVCDESAGEECSVIQKRALIEMEILEENFVPIERDDLDSPTP